MSAFAQRALIVTFPYPLWPFGPSPPDRGSRPPDPLSTRAGNFGCFVIPGGLNFDRTFSYSRPTGACCHQNLQAAASIAHRLLHPYLLSAAVIGRAKSRPASVLLSGRRALLPSKFASRCFDRTPPGASLPVEYGGGRVGPPTGWLPGCPAPLPVECSGDREDNRLSLCGGSHCTLTRE